MFVYFFYSIPNSSSAVKIKQCRLTIVDGFGSVTGKDRDRRSRMSERIQEEQDGVFTVLTDLQEHGGSPQVIVTCSMEPYSFISPHSHAEGEERYRLIQGQATFLIHAKTHWELHQLTPRQPELVVYAGEVHAISVNDDRCVLEYTCRRSHSASPIGKTGHHPVFLFAVFWYTTTHGNTFRDQN